MIEQFSVTKVKSFCLFCHHATTSPFPSIDDLLRAGINHASHVVISNKESDIDASEETLADAETVVTVQKISR